MRLCGILFILLFLLVLNPSLMMQGGYIANSDVGSDYNHHHLAYCLCNGIFFTESQLLLGS
jgi:hypothetical protein